MHDFFKTMTEQVSIKTGQEIDVSSIMGSELNSTIDYEMWMETIELQKTFNDQVAPGWRSQANAKDFNFWMAILDETVEVLGSRHWKWWKDKDKLHTVDWDNVQLELVDIMHFVISICIQQNSTSVLFSQLINLEMNRPTRIRDEKFFDAFWEEFLTAVQYKNLPLVAVRAVEFWYRAGGTAESLMREYRVKYALNNIRQEFGYASGKYIKMWSDVRGGYSEDNVIARRLAEEFPVDKDLIENIENSLREYYLNNVAI